jgi:hypothetical protein
MAVFWLLIFRSNGPKQFPKAQNLWKCSSLVEREKRDAYIEEDCEYRNPTKAPNHVFILHQDE